MWPEAVYRPVTSDFVGAAFCATAYHDYKLVSAGESG